MTREQLIGFLGSLPGEADKQQVYLNDENGNFFEISQMNYTVSDESQEVHIFFVNES